MRSPRLWFYLEDVVTGENREVVTHADGTEQDARSLLGGSWTDPRRVLCHGPNPLQICPIELAE